MYVAQLNRIAAAAAAIDADRSRAVSGVHVAQHCTALCSTTAHYVTQLLLPLLLINTATASYNY
jgi:hypothetical protein